MNSPKSSSKSRSRSKSSSRSSPKSSILKSGLKMASVQKTVKNMMGDQNVLYVVAFLAFANVLGYLAKQNSQAVIFFLIVGFLTTYFSKNMIVVLLTAMVTTNLFVMSRMTFVVKEGMTDGADADANADANADADADATDADGDDADSSRPHEDSEKQPVGASHKMDAKKKKASYKKANSDGSKYDSAQEETTEGLAMPATEAQEEGGEDYATVPSKGGDHIDYSKTLESAYGNLEKILGEGGMKDISKTTQDLMSQQKLLMDNMNQMAPMMKAAEGFMDKFSGGGQLGGLLGGMLGGNNKK